MEGVNDPRNWRRKAADCVVKEAEDDAKVEADHQGRPLNDKTKVPPPDGSLTAGTLVRFADGSARAVETLAPGDALWTPAGEARLLRVDLCRHDLVALDMEGTTLVIIASYHRLMNACGEWRRADEHAVGDRLSTRLGPRVVPGRRMLAAEVTHRLGFQTATVCAVGDDGVWARCQRPDRTR